MDSDWCATELSIAAEVVVLTVCSSSETNPQELVC